LNVLEDHQIIPTLASAEILEFLLVELDFTTVDGGVIESEVWVIEIQLFCIVIK
jgi:hypothetical protein